MRPIGTFGLGISFGFLVSDFGLKRRRRAFSLLEFFVAAAVLVILLAIFIPYLQKVREDNNRLRCFDNLRALGTALGDYTKSNAGDYPRVIFNAGANQPGYTCFTGPDSPNPFAANSSVRPADVTASLWLLIRQKLAQPADFICPSTSDVADTLTDAAGESTPLQYRSNFRDPENLSYSYACPFSAATGYHFNSDRLGSDFAVLADKNPGPGAAAVPASAPPLQLASANSPNHRRAGQNVLYADGHAEFRSTPYCGMDHDNIFTAQSDTPLSKPSPTANGVVAATIGPASPTDSYLIPTAADLPSDSGPMPPAPKPQPPAPKPKPKPAPPAPPPAPKPIIHPPPPPAPVTPPTTQPRATPAPPTSRPASPPAFHTITPTTAHSRAMAAPTSHPATHPQ